MAAALCRLSRQEPLGSDPLEHQVTPAQIRLAGRGPAQDAVADQSEFARPTCNELATLTDLHDHPAVLAVVPVKDHESYRALALESAGPKGQASEETSSRVGRVFRFACEMLACLLVRNMYSLLGIG